MSVVCLRLLILIICISTALCDEVVWKKTGESYTFQCKTEEQNIIAISLKKNLGKNHHIFSKTKSSDEAEFDSSRSEPYDDIFPNFQIVLKNLVKNDTGVYWCLFAKSDLKENPGKGSVLLIVTDPIALESTAPCPQNYSNQDWLVTSVVISAAVLFILFLIFLLLVIRKVKYLRFENNPSPAPRNDVYEEMRGTIRR